MVISGFGPYHCVWLENAPAECEGITSTTLSPSPDVLANVAQMYDDWVVVAPIVHWVIG